MAPTSALRVGRPTPGELPITQKINTMAAPSLLADKSWSKFAQRVRQADAEGR